MPTSSLVHAVNVAVSTLLFTSAAKLIAALHYTPIRIADASKALPFDKLKLLTHDGYYGVLENELSERQRQCRWKLALEECAATQSEVAPSVLLG